MRNRARHILGALAGAAVFSSWAAGAPVTVFDNFQGTFYSTESGTPISGTGSGLYRVAAMAFTPSASGVVHEIDLPLSIVQLGSLGDDADVFNILPDDNGLPNTNAASIAAFAVVVTNLATFPGYTVAALTPYFNSEQPILAGQQYWLVGAPTPSSSPDSEVWATNTTGQIGTAAQQFDIGGPFTQEPNAHEAAFRVSVDAVPEPSAALLGLGAAAMLPWASGRRRMGSQRS